MNLKEVCRTCLRPSKSMLSIFSAIQVENSELRRLSILEMLKTFTEIWVFPNDGLPERICSDCLDDVQQSYTFKLKIEKSQVILKELKDNGKNMNEFINSPNETITKYFSQTPLKLIKSEVLEDYEASTDQQPEQTSLPESSVESITKQEISLVQEVKQEPEIELMFMEEVNFNETDSDEKCDLQCSVCTKIFKTKNNLKAHILTHAEEKPFQCEVCKKDFRLKVNLTVHMQTTHVQGATNNGKFKCTTCSKLFITNYQLNRHMISHSEERPFSCEICSKKFRSKGNLLQHLQAVHADATRNTRKFKCAICSRLFVRKSVLNRHMIIHTDERPFKCDLCSANFRYKGNLTEHIQTVHTEDASNTEDFKCAVCSKLFVRKSLLNRHMQNHTNEKRFQCVICPKNFQYKGNLMEHIQTIHTEGEANKKRFKCATCSKSFRYKRYLTQHMFVHTDERPFQCELCPKNFRCKSNLTIHLQTAHSSGTTNSTDLKCAICSKLFGHKRYLKQHMFIHSEERQFQCKDCSKIFRTKGSLKTHMQRMHDVDINSSELIVGQPQ